MNKKLKATFMSAILASGLSACTGTSYTPGEPVKIDDEIGWTDTNRVLSHIDRAERTGRNSANSNIPNVIEITIDSPGGRVQDGYRIINRLQESQAQVHLKCEGKAASMAAIILITATGRDRDAKDSCTIMIHQSYYEVRDPNNPRRNLTRTLYEALLPQYQIAKENPHVEKFVINQTGDPPYELSRHKLINWVEQLAYDRRNFVDRLAATTRLNTNDIEYLLSNGDNYFTVEEAAFAGMIDTIEGRTPSASQINQGREDFCAQLPRLSVCG